MFFKDLNSCLDLIPEIVNMRIFWVDDWVVSVERVVPLGWHFAYHLSHSKVVLYRHILLVVKVNILVKFYRLSRETVEIWLLGLIYLIHWLVVVHV